MNLLSQLGAVLMRLLASLPALVHKNWVALKNWTPPGLIPGEAGLISIIYTSNITYPAGCTVPAFTAGATAPTVAQIQASQVPTLYGTIMWADGDTAAVFTTNWGAAGMLAAGNAQYQQVDLNKILGGASDSSFATNFTCGLTLTNAVVITKVGVGANQGGTWAVSIRLPWSASL